MQNPVVAAGTALLAAAALGATSFAAPATVVGGVAAVGAGAGGMMLAETQCLGKYYLHIYLSIYLHAHPQQRQEHPVLPHPGSRPAMRHSYWLCLCSSWQIVHRM